jgi:hypothetical protein
VVVDGIIALWGAQGKKSSVRFAPYIYPTLISCRWRNSRNHRSGRSVDMGAVMPRDHTTQLRRIFEDITASEQWITMLRSSAGSH